LWSIGHKKTRVGAEVTQQPLDGATHRSGIEPERRAGWCRMTAASPSGTPLIIVVLALCVSFLSAMGSIAAVLVARANLQRQIQATAREAWMREFREQVAAFLSAAQVLKLHVASHTGAPEAEKIPAELRDAMGLAYHTIRFLIAEKGEQQHADFIQSLDGLLLAPADQEVSITQKLTMATTDILRRERAVIETDQAIRWQPWLQLKAWLARDPPHWPN
jgi:hypothetical protein